MAIDKYSLNSYPTIITEAVGHSGEATLLKVPKTCGKVTIEAEDDPIFIASEGTDAQPMSSNRSKLSANESKEFLIGSGNNRNGNIYISSQDPATGTTVTIWFEEN